MVGILILSHSTLAKGLSESCEMISGKKTEYISLTDEGIGIFETQVYNKLDELFSSYKEVLVFCDIRGGTPCNTALRYKLEKRANLEVIVGTNLPMILSCLEEVENFTDSSFLEELLETSKEEIEKINI